MYKGVLIDWGGVLTTGLREAVQEWIVADRIDPGHYREVMGELVVHAYEGGLAPGENPIHALERGELPVAEFERRLATRLRTLDGEPPEADGLLERMFTGFRPVEEMNEMLRLARAAGLSTCLLSNSWGNSYPRDGWDVLFDAVVISGEVGMRKPEERIFRHALGLIALEPGQCVFIDDIEANILAARTLGLVGIHHFDPGATIAEMERLFGLPFRAAPMTRPADGPSGALRPPP
ncbi:HAD family hydrolase [Microbispora sp. ATCC PTA-5024]|uniref:HAD family hydrolase n=1 Tax=Microbispora sp. ATCC PTA-5024 TaxID=316330 RepID=UPI0003DD13F2|nr:HAD family phosphatase [Microbispora sp. ATCC PTA-5024]ETK33666.1 haloacid dehalogenase [Microbispora sp. ATCC PTA-5024]